MQNGGLLTMQASVPYSHLSTVEQQRPVKSFYLVLHTKGVGLLQVANQIIRICALCTRPATLILLILQAYLPCSAGPSAWGDVTACRNIAGGQQVLESGGSMVASRSADTLAHIEPATTSACLHQLKLV